MKMKLLLKVGMRLVYIYRYRMIDTSFGESRYFTLQRIINVIKLVTNISQAFKFRMK